MTDDQDKFLSVILEDEKGNQESWDSHNYTPAEGFDFQTHYDVTDKYESPEEWVTDALAKFLHMTQLSPPEELKLNTESEKVEAYLSGITLALIRVREFIAGEGSYIPADYVYTAASWVEEAILTHLYSQQFFIIPERWDNNGSTVKNNTMMDHARMIALQTVRKWIQEEAAGNPDPQAVPK